MDYFRQFWELILHIDVHLSNLVGSAGIWAYFILFFVVFAETAFIITVFLPSDSVLFAACALASASNSLSFPILVVMFFTAALLGDSLNFTIGTGLRKTFQKKNKFTLISEDKIAKTREFYDRNGGITVIIARFIPVLRSLAPFVAGISFKDYKWFIKHNVIGVTVWNLLFCFLGFFFGNIGYVKDNFGLIIVGLAVLSLLTGTISIILSKIFMKSK